MQQGVRGQFIQYVAPGSANGPPVNTGIWTHPSQRGRLDDGLETHKPNERGVILRAVFLLILLVRPVAIDGGKVMAARTELQAAADAAALAAASAIDRHGEIVADSAHARRVHGIREQGLRGTERPSPSIQWWTWIPGQQSCA